MGWINFYEATDLVQVATAVLALAPGQFESNALVPALLRA